MDFPIVTIDQPDVDGTMKPMIVVNYKDEEKQFSAEEISSMVLLKMKEIASDYLGTEIKYAVVTVPAYFNNKQRQATKDAGTIAGLDILRIINEPTAAAIAYGLDKRLTSCAVGTKNVLVFDLGGGTFDVSLVVIGKDLIEVKAVNGNTHLGGGDFDKRMVNHFVAKFERKHNKNISSNMRALGRLRAACEKAKRHLSTTLEASIDIDCLSDGIDFSTTINRARFEKMNMDLFQSCLEPVAKCLEDAKIEKTGVDEIVLVGGSTRIPMVRQLLQAFFDGKELCKGINPDEAVAYGAASHAAVLAGESGNKNVVLVDVTPLSLGIELEAGDMKVFIPRNTTIPTKKIGILTTTIDNQTYMSYPVYEGERPVANENNYLGLFFLVDIIPEPQGIPRFEIVFEIDADGILTVSAKDLRTENESQITISNLNSRLSKEDIDKMVNEANKYKTDGDAFKNAVTAKNYLEDYIEKVKRMLRESGANISLWDKSKMRGVIQKIEQWIDRNNECRDARMFEEKTRDLSDISKPFFGSTSNT